MGEFHSHPGTPDTPPLRATVDSPEYRELGRPVAVFVDGVRQDRMTRYDVTAGFVERVKTMDGRAVTEDGARAIERITGVVRVKWD